MELSDKENLITIINIQKKINDKSLINIDNKYNKKKEFISQISKFKNNIFINKIIVKNNKLFKIFKIIIIYICIAIFHLSMSIKIKKKYVWLKKHMIKKQKHQSNLNIALCTMGKAENLYLNEFIDYYIKLGINHIFIYDNNDPNYEKMKDILNKRYKKNVTIYENIKTQIKDQTTAFTHCYQKNKNIYDWFIWMNFYI